MEIKGSIYFSCKVEKTLHLSEMKENTDYIAIVSEDYLVLIFHGMFNGYVSPEKLKLIKKYKKMAKRIGKPITYACCFPAQTERYLNSIGRSDVSFWLANSYHTGKQYFICNRAGEEATELYLGEVDETN